MDFGFLEIEGYHWRRRIGFPPIILEEIERHLEKEMWSLEEEKRGKRFFFFWEKNSKYLLCPCYALLPIILHVFNISTFLWIFVWAYFITNSHCRYIVYDKWLFFYVLFSFLIFYLNSFWGCNNDYFSSSLIIVYSFWGSFCILWDLWYDMFMS